MASISGGGQVRAAQKLVMPAKDARIKASTECFASIRVIKIYHWEDAFEERITGYRQAELAKLKSYQARARECG